MPSRRSACPPKGSESLSPDALRDLLAHLLSGVAGDTEVRRRELVGEVEQLSIVFNPRSNWRVAPSGTETERATIQKAVEVVRIAHPYVTAQLTDKS